MPSQRAFWTRIFLILALSALPMGDLEMFWFSGRAQVASLLQVASSGWIWLPWPVEWLTRLGLVLWVADLVLRYPILVSTLAGLGTTLLWFFPMTQFIAQTTGVYVPVTHGQLATFLSFGIFAAYRLSVQEIQGWRQNYQSHLISLLGHDLKTPLAQLESQLMRLRRNLIHAPEELSVLESATQDLRRSIQGLLELAQIESKQLGFRPQQVDLNRMIEETRARFLGTALARGVQLVCDLEPLFPISGDPDLLRKILSNLIDNGIKFSPRGGTLIIRSRELADAPQGLKTPGRHSDTTPRWAAVSVEDEGPGITEAVRQRLFQLPSPLQARSSPSETPAPPGGSGIGLYLSRVFIELHGGVIEYRSREPVGGVFCFYLPF